jgi:hypothetical protein
MNKKDTYAEEYLTVDELSERIKYKKQSLYNLIYRREFVLGKHYLKPSPKKILFKWTEIIDWLGDKFRDHTQENNACDYIQKSEKNFSFDNTNSEGCRIKI